MVRERRENCLKKCPDRRQNKQSKKSADSISAELRGGIPIEFAELDFPKLIVSLGFFRFRKKQI